MLLARITIPGDIMNRDMLPTNVLLCMVMIMLFINLVVMSVSFKDVKTWLNTVVTVCR